MLNNFVAALNAVFPLLALILSGFVINKKGWISDQTRAELNKIVFRLFMPILIIMNLYTTELDELISLKLVLFIIIVTLLSIIIASLIYYKLVKDHKKRGPLIQGAYRSNFIFYGIPIISSLFGQEGVAVVVVAIALVVPLYNFTSVIVLIGFSDVKTAAINVIKNPLIIGTIAGLVIKYSGIQFPSMIEESLSMMSVVATPMALFLLGTTIGNRKFSDHERSLIISSTIFKLVGFPLIFMSIGIALGFRDIELAIIMLMLGAPTSISSYNMAAEMGADEDIASSIVLLTTVFSLFTIFVYIFILRSLGLI